MFRWLKIQIQFFKQIIYWNENIVLNVSTVKFFSHKVYCRTCFIQLIHKGSSNKNPKNQK